MKKTLLAVFVVLVAISLGTYYTYLTDKGFKYFVNDLLKNEKDTVSIPSPKTLSPQPQAKSQHKALKKIKRDQYFKLDSFARKTPKAYEKDIETLGNYLVTPAHSDLEKARLIFTWVATHVHYDDASFNSGNIQATTAENVLLTKKAVCDGYSTLFAALCTSAGLEAEKISGYAKGYGYTAGEKFKEINHAWNIVKIDNQWKLFDATWANGYGTNKKGKLVSTTKFDPYWFDVNPKEFIFTHLPEDPKWQLLSDTLSLEKFEGMPYVSDEFFKLGFDVNQVFSDAFSGNVKELATAYPVDFPAKVIRAPYARNLTRNEPVTFVIQSDYAEFIRLDDGGNWEFFKEENNTFTLTYIPKGNSVTIYQSIDGSFNFLGIIKYKVSSKEIAKTD